MLAKILVSQPKPQTEKSPYYEVAKKYNVDLVFRPFIKIDPMSAKDFRQQKSVAFFMHFVLAHCDKIAVENPIGIMSSIYKKPTQII
jgi:uroporphyrinogen-III synthase